MPETSFSGRSTRTARSVRRSGELFFLILIVAKLKTREKKKIFFNSENKSFLLFTPSQQQQNPSHSKDSEDMTLCVIQNQVQLFSVQLQNKKFQ
jgi:hypothetical protein